MIKINRRELLKLSASALVAVLASPFSSAQTNTAPVGVGSKAGAAAAPVIDSNISYNAGWVVPLDDKAALLELEARKTKERDDLAKQKAGVGTDPAAAPKENSKSIGSRFQEVLGKIKNFF